MSKPTTKEDIVQKQVALICLNWAQERLDSEHNNERAQDFVPQAMIRSLERFNSGELDHVITPTANLPVNKIYKQFWFK